MIYIRKADERGGGNHGWLQTHHTFSFADYYDPGFMGFSTLRVINEDFVQVSQGFGTHPHRNMEILTYVLEGTVEHKDSMGNKEQIKAGEFQIMSAGTGITHSEYNPSSEEILHLYQIWILPEREGITPRYETKMFDNHVKKQLILSQDEREDSLKIYQNMQLWRYQISKDEQITLNSSEKFPNLWIQVVKGDLSINGQSITTSDGVAIHQESNISIQAENDAEILVFELE